MLYRHGLVTLKITYTQPHGRQAIYQRAVPKALQSRYGKKIIKVLIPSQDAAVVAREAARINTQVEADWAALRADLDAQPRTSHYKPAEIRTQAAALLARYDLNPLDGLKGRDGPGDPPTRAEQMIDLLHQHLEDRPPKGPLQQAAAVAAVSMLAQAPAPLISDLRDLYLSTHRKTNKEGFRKSVNIAFDALVSAIGDKPVTEVSREDARAFINAAITKGNKTTTARRRLNVYGAAWKIWRLERDPQQINPFESVSIADEGQDSTKRHTYSPEEVAALYAECRKLDDDMRWLYAMMIDTGARIAEVTGLALSDIHLTRPDGTPEPIPYVELKPHPWRSIKTEESREVPLVSAARSRSVPRQAERQPASHWQPQARLTRAKPA